MIKLDTTGEKFSSALALRVLGEMSKYKKCSAGTVSKAVGKSKTTVCRVVKYLEREHLIQKYRYRSIVGRGAKPDEYFIHPKTACAVLDLREGELNLYVYSIPGNREFVISPKIRADHPMAEKAELIRGVCFDALTRLVPSKYLWSVSVLTDAVSLHSETYPEDPASYIPEDLSSDVFLFTSEELESAMCARDFPDETVLYLHVDEHRREALIFEGGKTVMTKDISKLCDMKDREISLPKMIGAVSAKNAFSHVIIFSPFLSSLQKEEISNRSAAKVEFIGTRDFNVRTEAVKRSIELLTAFPPSKRS